jgi:hypothetical protein
VIATPACNDGGVRERVPPASDTLFCARDRSRTGETQRGSVQENADFLASVLSARHRSGSEASENASFSSSPPALALSRMENSAFKRPSRRASRAFRDGNSGSKTPKTRKLRLKQPLAPNRAAFGKTHAPTANDPCEVSGAGDFNDRRFCRKPARPNRRVKKPGKQFCEGATVAHRSELDAFRFIRRILRNTRGVRCQRRCVKSFA